MQPIQTCREATEDDLVDILDMASKFWNQVGYDEEFDRESALDLLGASLVYKLLAVAISDDKVVGFAAGLLSPLLVNKNIIQGNEIAWWIEPDYRENGLGVDLLVQLENQARDQDIEYWNMVFLHNSMPEIVESIYEKLGYVKTETTYTKAL